MPRYTEKELSTENIEPKSAIITVASVISAVLVSTGLVGALVWFNIFVWSKVF